MRKAEWRRAARGQGLLVRRRLHVDRARALIADLERVCGYLILVGDGRVRLSGEVDELLATHRRLSGPRRDGARLPARQQVIEETHTDRQSTLLVRAEEPIIDPAWSVEAVSLEDIVLAYMRLPSGDAAIARIGR